MVSFGRSSISQCPAPGRTTVSTSEPTSSAWRPRASPFAFSPPHGEDRHRQLRPGQRLEVLGGLRKRREVGPARAHPSRTSVGRGVGGAIRLGDRARLVGGEVVPEVLEVGPLTSLHEGLGRRTVEAEVPDAGVVVDRPPSRDAREERVHQHELLDLGRELRGVRVGDHQPDVVADDARSLDAQGPGEGVNDDGRALHVEPRLRDPRVADPGQIRRDHPELPGEARDERPPHSRRLGVAVQQDHDGAAAGGEVVQPHPFDLRAARLDPSIPRSGPRQPGGRRSAQDERERDATNDDCPVPRTLLVARDRLRDHPWISHVLSPSVRAAEAQT